MSDEEMLLEYLMKAYKITPQSWSQVKALFDHAVSQAAEQAERALVELRAEGVHLQGKIAAASDKIEQAEREVAMWKDMGEKEHALAVQFAQEKEQAERAKWELGCKLVDAANHHAEELSTLRPQLHAAQEALRTLLAWAGDPECPQVHIDAARAALSPRPTA